MGRALLILALMLTLAGCDKPAPEPPELVKTISTTPEKPTLHRFTVESFGTFCAGYDNNKREILIVTDTQTGTQYLTITGCGTMEMRRESDGDSSVTRER